MAEIMGRSRTLKIHYDTNPGRGKVRTLCGANHGNRAGNYAMRRPTRKVADVTCLLCKKILASRGKGTLQKYEQARKRKGVRGDKSH